MQIFSRNLSNELIIYHDVTSLDTVEMLKSKIQDRLGIPADQLRLRVGCSPLQDGKTLADYKIQDESFVHLDFGLSCRNCPVCTDPENKISPSIIRENKTVDSINWNLMVVFEAKSHIQSWERVGGAMSERFKFASDFHLQPVSSTRALLCIENDTEREYLFRQEPWVFENNQFQFVPWSPSLNLLSPAEIVEITAKWVLVKGVPFSFWNQEMFETIGAQCGGLLEVSHFTKFALNLSSIKLKVKGPLLSDAFTLQVNLKPVPFTASVEVAADQSERIETTTGRVKISANKSVN